MFSIIESLWNCEYNATLDMDMHSNYKKEFYDMKASREYLLNEIGDDSKIKEAFKLYDCYINEYHKCYEYEAFRMGFILASVLSSEVLNCKLFTIDDELKELRNKIFYNEFDEKHPLVKKEKSEEQE